MIKKIFTIEQTEEIKWALSIIKFPEWNNSNNKELLIHSVDHATAVDIFDNYLKEFNCQADVIICLKQNERINKLLEFIYENELNIEDVTDLFDSTLSHLQNKINVQKVEYENKIKDLQKKKLCEL